MTLFILSSNNERIPFQSPNKTPFVLTSTLKLKEPRQERKPDSYSPAKTTKKEDTMKEKQFGSLEIMITKRKVNVQTVQAKKRNGMIDQISFPENLDDSFHQGLLSNCNERGLEKLNSESLNMWTQKEGYKSSHLARGQRADRGPDVPCTQSFKCSQSNQDAPLSLTMIKKKHEELPISQEIPRPQLINTGQTRPNLPTLTDDTITAKTSQLSCLGDSFFSAIPKRFKVPETPLIHDLTFIPETPFLLGTHQHKVQQHKNRDICPVVPETPSLSDSPVIASKVQRGPIQVKAKEKHLRPSHDKNLHLSKREFIQEVPQTPFLKLRSSVSEEISLYE